MTGTTPPPLGSRPLSQVRTEVVVGRLAVADDIVTRLRGWVDRMDPSLLILTEAADEIVRLRAELQQSRQDHLATFLELMEERCG